jgi:hypothetical protein
MNNHNYDKCSFVYSRKCSSNRDFVVLIQNPKSNYLAIHSCCEICYEKYLSTKGCFEAKKTFSKRSRRIYGAGIND